MKDTTNNTNKDRFRKSLTKAAYYPSQSMAKAALYDSVPLFKKKGRGAISNTQNRFATQSSDLFYNDTHALITDNNQSKPTEYIAEHAKSIITCNRSPDIPFDRSINPYRGCEHGCVYCFARPSHSYLDLSPGLDFESKIFYKRNAAELLTKEIAKTNYRCSTIALGVNTDAYQPIEKQLGLTRELLTVLLRCRHPVSIITKSSLILRDLDILTKLAQHNLISVMISVTTLDDKLKRIMEPRTANAAARIKTIATLSDHNIPVGVLAAPMIPKVNDNELEAILKACQIAGASRAGYILLRLPFELQTILIEWLKVHFPDRADSVMNILSSCHGGKAYRSHFGKRMTGSGTYSEVLSQRFYIACKKLKLTGHAIQLNTQDFIKPRQQSENNIGESNKKIQALELNTTNQRQMSLFL